MSTPAGLIAPGTYISALSGGRKTVPTAGTRVQLSATPVSCQGVIVQALRSNAGNVAVGGPDVSSSSGGENGVEIVAGQTITLFVKDLSLVYIDADNNGDGVQYLLLYG